MVEQVDKKAVARQNLRLSYDKKSSFFGTDVPTTSGSSSSSPFCA